MYLFKDSIYTKDQLDQIAEAKGYSFDELLANNPDIVLDENGEGDGDKKKKKKENVEKPQDTANGADVVSVPAAPETTELQSDATSLDIVPVDLNEIINTDIDLEEEIEQEPVIEKIKETRTLNLPDQPENVDYEMEQNLFTLQEDNSEDIQEEIQELIGDKLSKGEVNLADDAYYDRDDLKLMNLLKVKDEKTRIKSGDVSTRLITGRVKLTTTGDIEGTKDVIDSSYYVPVYMAPDGKIIEGKPIALIDREISPVLNKAQGKPATAGEAEYIETVERPIIDEVENLPSYKKLDAQQQQNLSTLDDLYTEYDDLTQKQDKEAVKLIEIKIKENLNNLSGEASITLERWLSESGRKLQFYSDIDKSEKKVNAGNYSWEQDFKFTFRANKDKYNKDGELLYSKGDIVIQGNQANNLLAQESNEIKNTINTKFLRNGIGAEVDGDEVYVFKNPVFFTKSNLGDKDEGEIGNLSFVQTALANGITMEEIENSITPGSFTSIEAAATKLLLEKGFGAQATFGILEIGRSVFKPSARVFGKGSDMDNAQSMFNFIDKNLGERRVLETIPRDYKDDGKIDKQREANLENTKNSIQKLENILPKAEEKVTKIKELADEVENSKADIDSYNAQTKNKAEQLVKRQADINEDVNSITEDFTKQANLLKGDLRLNPNKQKEILNKLANLEQEYKTKIDGRVKDFNDINILLQDLDDTYQKEFIDRKTNYDKLFNKFQKEGLEIQNIQEDVANLLQIVNVSDLTNLRLQLETDTINELTSDIEKYAEGQGSFIAASVNSVSKQFFTSLGGKVVALQDISRFFNELGNMTGVIGDSEYKYNISMLDAQAKSLPAEVKGAAGVFEIKGIDRFYQKSYDESIVGGVVSTFGQMLGASLSSPVGGLFGGYFFSSLLSNVEETNQLEEDFIAQYQIDNPEASSREARQVFKKDFRKDVNFARRYLQASVEGGLEYLGGKILGGSFSISKSLTKKLTANLISNLSGKVTLKTLQRDVQLMIGDLMSKAVKRLGRTTAVGLEEVLVELTQEISSVRVDQAFASSLGKGVELDLPDMSSKAYQDQLKHIATISFLTGAVGGVYQASVQAPKVLSGVDLLKGEDRATVELYTRERANILRDAGELQSFMANLPKTDPLRKQKIAKAQQLYDIYNGINQNLSGIAQTQVAELYVEKQALETRLKGQNKYDVAGINKAIKEIQDQIDAIETDPNNVLVETDADQAAAVQQEIGEQSGRNITEVESEQDFIKAAEDAGLEISGKEDALYVKGNGKIIVNKQAIKKLFSISAETHEILHDITAQELQGLNEDQKQSLIKDFQGVLSKSEYDAVIARLKKDYGNENQATTEEWFNAFHDAVVRGDIQYNQSIFDQIGQWLINNVPGFKRLFSSEKDLSWDSAQGVYNFIKDYSVQTKERIEGKRDQFTPEIQEVVNVETPTTQETQVIQMTDQAQPAMAASQSVSNMASAFDSAVTEDIKTNEDFKNSDAAFVAYNEITENTQFDSYINQLINRDSNLQSLPDNVKREVNRKIKEELQLRVLKNFSPVLDGNKRSLFSYLYGKKQQGGLGGIAQKALLDVKKDYAKRVPTTSIDQTTDDTSRPRDIQDTSVNIEDQIDEGEVEVPKSKLKQASPELVDQQLEDAIETAVLEIEAGVKPDIDDKNFRSFIKETLEAKITPAVLKKFGTGKNYEEFIKVLAPKLRKNMPPQFFVKLESQTKPADRIFTKPPVKLTKQADIDAAQLRDDVFVENTAQGVNLYELKQFTDKQLIDKVFPPLTNPKTGKRSGARGNVKKSVAESVAAELGKDMVPPVFRKSTKPQDLSKISRKLQRDPRAMFSNSQQTVLKSGSSQIVYEDYILDKGFWNKLAVDLKLNSYNFNKAEDREAFKKDEMPKLIKMLPKVFFKSSPGTFAGTPKSVYRKVNGVDTKMDYKTHGLPFDSKTGEGGLDRWLTEFEKSDQFEGYGPPFKNEDASDMDQATMKDALSRVGQTTDKFDKGFGNKEFVEQIDNKERILEQFFERVQDGGKSLQQASLGVLQATSFHQSHFMRTICPIRFRQLGMTGSIVEEHALGASLTAKQAFLLASDGIVKGNFTGITKNFLQGPITRINDNKVNRKEYGMKTGPKKQDLFFTLMGAYDWAIRYASVPDFDLNTLQYIDENNNVVMLTDYYNVRVDAKSFPELIAFQNDLIVRVVKGQITKDFAREQMDLNLPVLQEQNKAGKEDTKMLSSSKVLSVDDSLNMQDILSKALGIDAALKYANKLDQPIKKIRVFDFDDTLAFTKSDVLYTSPDGKTGKLNAEQFAKRGAELKEQGYDFDFSEFNKVSQGKRGPLFDIAKKIKEARGNEDIFVLTARAPEARFAIYEFLKAEGLEFKLDNIIGLGNSKGEAKANWIIDKAAEGYNDFYFADDAYQNVRAVQDALNVIDVKSKVQQAKVRLSNSLSEEFNKVIEETTGIEFYKEYSAAKAKTIGASKGKFNFFIPYSAEDMLGLIYPTLSKGRKGDAQMAWYKTHLLNPYMSAMESLSAARVNLMNDFKALKKELNIPKDLKKQTESGFTNEQAVRVHLYTMMGYDIPGLSKKDLKELNDIIINDPKLSLFAEQILSITKGDGYAKPDQNWLSGTITTDLIELLNKVKRSKYLKDSGYTDNVNAIYSEANLNKLEALYGSKYREALENMLSRMKSGRNRVSTGNRLSNRVLDYINGSIGTIMFFNTRSAVLQTISSINFINWSFNNPYQAGKAFANQKQYWKDFTMLMNSDYLKDRRNGLRLNISESEIADAAATSKNKAKAAISYILEKGYLPTQYADSFAIASGGATYYRNRVNDLVKNQSMTQSEAEAQALIDWRSISEESQQSSDPSKISQQQSSDLGRIVLAFANTPMQYARLQKRAIQDLANKRGDWKANMSKVIYYGVVQNLIFNALQQAVFALGFGDDDDEDSKQEKYLDTANGMLDSLLRGLGIGGQAVSVSKNFLLDLYERSGRSRPEYVDSVWNLTKFSPPIYSKISKLKQAAWHFDSKKRRQKMFDDGFNLGNPAYEAFAKVISAITNVPLDRVLYKIDNIGGALNEDNDVWERVAMLLGWPQWQLESKKDKEAKKPKSKKSKRGGIKIKKQVIKIK